MGPKRSFYLRKCINRLFAGNLLHSVMKSDAWARTRWRNDWNKVTDQVKNHVHSANQPKTMNSQKEKTKAKKKMISLFGMLFFLLFFYKKTTTERLSFFCYPLQLFLAIGHSCAVILCILWAFFLLSLLRLHLLHKSYSEKKTARREKERECKRHRKRAKKSEKEWERLSKIRRNRRKNRDKAHQLHPKNPMQKQKNHLKFMLTAIQCNEMYYCSISVVRTLVWKSV